MDKEEVLEKAREGNASLDEREANIYHRSFGFGMVIVTILCLAFSVIRAIQGEQFYEFGVIIFTYLGAINFYQYFKLRIKRSFFAGVVCAVATVADLIGYFFLD